jgi:hypothetical protein
MKTNLSQTRVESVEHLAPGQPIQIALSPVPGFRGGEWAEAPGTVPLRPGDFVLTHGDAWTSKLIRFGQGLRFRGPDAKYTYWNHAVIVVDYEGTIIEAIGSGVVKRNIAVYEPTQRTVVHIDAAEQDREQARAFAESALNAEYGYLTIVSMAYSLITGGKFSIGFDGQHICSGLVARALERTGLIFEHDPSHIMPADLAKLYDVNPPPPGTPRGVIPPRSAR